MEKAEFCIPRIGPKWYRHPDPPDRTAMCPPQMLMTQKNLLCGSRAAALRTIHSNHE
jgi:hypothetical protein